MAALQAWCYVTRKKRSNKAVCGQQTWLMLRGESKPIISVSQVALYTTLTGVRGMSAGLDTNCSWFAFYTTVHEVATRKVSTYV